MTNREAYIVLNMISGVGTARFKVLVNATSIPVAKLNGMLTKMAMKMMLVQHPGKIYSLRG